MEIWSAIIMEIRHYVFFLAFGIPCAGILFRRETIHLFEERKQMHPHLPGYVVF